MTSNFTNLHVMLYFNYELFRGEAVWPWNDLPALIAPWQAGEKAGIKIWASGLLAHH